VLEELVVDEELEATLELLDATELVVELVRATVLEELVVLLELVELVVTIELVDFEVEDVPK